MNCLLLVLFFSMAAASPSPSPKPPIVLLTDGYFVHDWWAKHLVGHEVETIFVGKDEPFNLNLKFRAADGAKSPCDFNAKKACRLHLDVFQVKEDGTRVHAFDFGEPMEVRLHPDTPSNLTIPWSFPAGKAPLGDVVLVVRWMFGNTELFRFEYPFNITG